MPVKAAGGSLISDAKLKELYASMLRGRMVAEHARRMRNRRAMAFYRASIGQEAIAAGCGIDLRPADTVVDTVGLANGVPLREFFAQLGARASQTTPLRQQLKAATSAAVGNKEKNSDVVMVFASAAAAARAGLRDSVKLAAARSLPIVFVVENNPWAGERRKVKMAMKGLTSITVDGNDVVAVYRVAYESLERVRQGGGPVLIEGKTYRQDGENSRRSERDPLAHMEQYLTAKGLFRQAWKERLVQKFTRELEGATRYLRASPDVAND